jgi:uncharacterized protein (DUF433 family)
MNTIDRITTEPDKLGGKPCIRGLRISVQDVLGYLASGMSETEIIHDFPQLEHEDFIAIYSYAASIAGKHASNLIVYVSNMLNER